MLGRYDYKVECAGRDHRQHAYACRDDRDRAVTMRAELEDNTRAHVRAHPGCAPWSIKVRFVSDWVDA